MSSLGKLYLVSVGPGTAELIAPMAKAALEESDAVVSYDLYLRWVAPWIEGKEIHTLPLTKEKERALLAIELARAGRVVSLVSSGDIGIYAMAALAFEEMSEEDRFECQLVPGISAANSCASLLGSPLSHDFATLSLSDLLCPWEWIEERARHIAQADLAVALYNVQSRQRQDGVYRILSIFLEHKSPQTLCGVVRNGYREGQETSICTLEELATRQFDMLTTVIVGNRFTRKKRGYIYTPRGYNAWDESRPVLPQLSCPGAVWVFSGTSDGNALARKLADSGLDVMISTASDYGREVAAENYPGLKIRSGRMGVEARRKELRDSAARAIVDGTHPFATEISAQLMELAKELEIPYVRYERPATELDPAVIRCRDMNEAAARAISLGQRIFLATGSKDLHRFIEAPGAADREWFVRLAPETSSMESALRLQIPRSHVCAMQGPFTREFNEALWRGWQIDCVVTKESGAAGGFEAKAEAAKALGIALIVIDRPLLNYPRQACHFEGVLEALTPLLEQP